MKKLILLLSLVAITFSACTKEYPDTPKEINIGVLRVPNDAILAKSAGMIDEMYNKKGIKVNYIVFDSGVDANKAFASNSIDFATMGNVPAVIACSVGIDVELIWLDEILGDVEALAVRDDSGINDVLDLKGKKVATSFACTTHYMLMKVLEDAKITDDVELLDMQTQEIVAAWQRGDIDAAYTWQPSLGALLNDSGHVLLSSADLAPRGYLTANVCMVNKNFSEHYPELVADYVTVMQKAYDYRTNNPDSAYELMAQEIGITKEEAELEANGSFWHTREEMIGSDLMGTSEAPGNFVQVMVDTGAFLKEESKVTTSPSYDDFSAFLNSKYIEMSLGVYRG